MATTPRLKLPFPNENSDPWFESFEAFAKSLDAALYAAREDRNTVLMGGGTLTFTASSNSLTWGANIEFFSPITGYLWRIAGPGNVTLADGDVAYVTVTRAPQQVTVVTLAVDTKVPTEPDGNNTLLFAIRHGSRVYFRNGAVIGDGDSAEVFQTGGGGASPGGLGKVTVTATNADVTLTTIQSSARLIVATGVPGGDLTRLIFPAPATDAAVYDRIVRNDTVNVVKVSIGSGVEFDIGPGLSHLLTFETDGVRNAVTGV